jgi:hypothetical protein
MPPVTNPLSGKKAGWISQLDIENCLKFNNKLTLLTLSAKDLVAVIEHAVADSAPGRTPGRFPQVAGTEPSALTPGKPAGSRIVRSKPG